MPSENKYLDYNGLQRYHANIVQYIADQLNTVTVETATEDDIDEILGVLSSLEFAKWELTDEETGETEEHHYSGASFGFKSFSLHFLLKALFGTEEKYIFIQSFVNQDTGETTQSANYVEVEFHEDEYGWKDYEITSIEESVEGITVTPVPPAHDADVDFTVTLGDVSTTDTIYVTTEK